MIKIIVYAYQMRKKNYDKKFLSAWLMKVETSRYKMRFFVKGFTWWTHRADYKEMFFVVAKINICSSLLMVV